MLDRWRHVTLQQKEGHLSRKRYGALLCPESTIFAYDCCAQRKRFYILHATVQLTARAILVPYLLLLRQVLHQVDHLVKFDTKVRFFFRSRYELWLEHLFQHAADHRRWKVAAANKMNVYSPGGEKKLFKPSSTSSLAASSYVEPVAPSKPEKEVTFNFPSKVSSLSMSMSFRASKRQKRVEAKKSFKRTRSKLVLMYNQTGMD